MTYEWKCPECGHVEEDERASLKDGYIAICPKCRITKSMEFGGMKRVFSCFIYSGPTGAGKKRPKRKT